MFTKLTKLMLFCTLLLTLMFSSQAIAQAQTFSCSNVTEIPQAECQELVTLYNSTHGVNWTNNTGWLATNTPCSWYGITCEEGHVIDISLGSYSFVGNNLSGTLPNLNLPNLQGLGLSGNQLTGTIPDFSNLTKLTDLSLSDNQLTGNIPDFSNLPNLEYFDAVSNKLTGNIPSFSNQPNLIGLALDNNQLIGHIPSFFNLSKLQYLFLSYNQLVGLVPNLNWSDFYQISLSQNCGLVAADSTQAALLDTKDPYWQVRNSECHFKVNPLNLTFVKLSADSDPISQTVTVSYSSTIAMTWTATISNAPWLSMDAMHGTTPSTVTMSVNSTGLSEGIYQGQVEFQSEGGVQVVTTTLTFFSCSGVTEIPQAECQELVTLYNSTHGVNWTDNTGWLATNTPCSWYGITCEEGHVIDISLSYYGYVGNNLSGTLPNLNLPELQGLYLYGNQLTGTIPDFSNLTKLTDLSLSDNQLTGTIPDFSNLTKLTDLSLSDNQLTGNIPDFSNLPELQELSLNGNQLTGSIPDFSNLPNLQVVDFRYNELTGNIPNFSNLANITKFYLSSNPLTGSIPNFSNLPKLQALSLSDNQLTGYIPEFSNLPDLEYFDAVSNKLIGNIPYFSNQPNLIGLALDNNQLTGHIPNFSSSPKLQYLFLSNNQLVGLVPNLNWSDFYQVSLSENCDLVSLDVAQANVLDSKDPHWRDRNLDCSFQANPPDLTFSMFLGDTHLPSSQDITINYGDTTTVTWTATISNAPWLSLNAMQGTAPSMVTVSVDPSSLLAGNYRGEIVITAADETHSRQTVMVNLAIDEVPTPTASSTPTVTATPTQTPTLTATPTPTLTPTFTATPTPTNTPLPTVTPNPHVISAVISPSGGVLTSTDGMAKVQFPTGLIIQPITVSLTMLTQTSHLTTAFKFTSRLFEIVATNNQNQGITQFYKPFTITFGYQDSDWSSIAQEADLSVYYWSVIENRWVNLLPCVGCWHDTVNNRFEIHLNHLTEFALLVAARQRLYLPVIMR